MEKAAEYINVYGNGSVSVLKHNDTHSNSKLLRKYVNIIIIQCYL